VIKYNKKCASKNIKIKLAAPAKYGNWHNGCGREYLFAKNTVTLKNKSPFITFKVVFFLKIVDLGRCAQILLLDQRTAFKCGKTRLSGLYDRNGGQISKSQFV